jgi:hypothetical protein
MFKITDSLKSERTTADGVNTLPVAAQLDLVVLLQVQSLGAWDPGSPDVSLWVSTQQD